MLKTVLMSMIWLSLAACVCFPVLMWIRNTPRPKKRAAIDAPAIYDRWNHPRVAKGVVIVDFIAHGGKGASGGTRLRCVGYPDCTSFPCVECVRVPAVYEAPSLTSRQRRGIRKRAEKGIGTPPRTTPICPMCGMRDDANPFPLPASGMCMRDKCGDWQ